MSVEVDLENVQGCVLKNVPIHCIVENETALRPADIEDPKFIQLADSIAKDGVYKPILVRELQVNPTTGEQLFGLVDGLQRFTAAKLAGLKSIPANVRKFNDAEVLKAQVIANHHKIETPRAQYAKQMLRLLTGDNTMTRGSLAKSLSIGTDTLDRWLSLSNLDPKIAELVDQEKIPLVSAYALAKLKPAAQLDLMDQAQTMNANQFVLISDQRARADRQEAKKGGTGEGPVFQPQPRLQKIGELKIARESSAIREAIKAKVDDKTSFDSGWEAALLFTMHLDPLSIEADKARFEADMKKRADDKAKRKMEQDAKRQDPLKLLGIQTPAAVTA